MNSSRPLTFGRVVMAVVLLIMAASYAHAQEGRPGDEELGETARVLLASANWLKQKNSGDRCSLNQDAKALVVAVRVLRSRLVSEKERILATESFISDLENDIAAVCPSVSSVPKTVCGLGAMIPYGRHGHGEPIPEMALAFLYMSEDDREEFLGNLSPVTRSALTDWFYEAPETTRDDIIESVSEDIGADMSWPSESERSVYANENDRINSDSVYQLDCPEYRVVIRSGPIGHGLPVPEIALALQYLEEDQTEKFVQNLSSDTDLLLAGWLSDAQYEEQADVLELLNQGRPYAPQSDVQQRPDEGSPFVLPWQPELNLPGQPDYEMEYPDNGVFDPWQGLETSPNPVD